MSTHPWHDVPHGSHASGMINAIIEIPKGSRAKYEIDKPTGLLKLDRVLFSSVYYPANYGFIPQSYGDDNDPLDILVLSQIEIVPSCIVYSKVIGVMRMIDGGLADDKIIAVAAADPSVNHYDNLSALPQHLLSEIRNFFENYTKLENKIVSVDAFKDKEEAMKIIEKALLEYRIKFS